MIASIPTAGNCGDPDPGEIVRRCPSFPGPDRGSPEILNITLLAGELDATEGGWPLAPLLDALFQRRVRATILCMTRGAADRDDPRFRDCPELAHRWLQPFTIRSLHSDARFKHTRLIHVLHDCMIDTGIALADAWRVPYLQTLNDIERVSTGLRMSRRWCRAFLVSCPEHARELTEQLAVPPDRVRVITPGIVPRPAPKTTRVGSVPVVGTAAASRIGAELLCFLQAARKLIDPGAEIEFLIAAPDSVSLELRRLARGQGLSDRVSLVDTSLLDSGFWSVLHVFAHSATEFGNVRALIRAMAEGIPCLGSRSPVNHRLISDRQTGLLVPAHDPGALAASILRLVNDPQAAARLGRQAQQAARTRFSLQAEADLLCQQYRSHSLPDSPAEG